MYVKHMYVKHMYVKHMYVKHMYVKRVKKFFYKRLKCKGKEEEIQSMCILSARLSWVTTPPLGYLH